MNSKVLPFSDALLSGSSLWIIPQPEVSHWGAKIDWYTGGLITNAEQRVPQTLSHELNRILTEEELVLPAVKNSPKAPLLVSSEPFLPNKTTVVLEYEGSI